MKTFRELISWELEQEKKGNRSIQITTEHETGKLGTCVLRKLRYLRAAAAAHSASVPSLKPFC